MVSTAGRGRILVMQGHSVRGIEEYLEPGESVAFATEDRVTVGNENGLWGFVTGSRALFYARRGLIMKSDLIIELPFETIHYCTIVTLGRKIRRMYLLLNDFVIRGDPADLVGMHRAVSAAGKINCGQT